MIIPRHAPRQFGARKRGDVVDIVIGEKQRRAMFIGSGRFSNVFLAGKRDVFIYTHFGDLSKKILSWCQGHGDRNPHIPSMERIETIYKGREDEFEIHVYKSRLYETPVKAMHRSYEWARELHKARREAGFATNINMGLSKCDTSRADDINRLVIRKAQIPDRMREALEEIADKACDYGDNVYLFDDFKPRNLGLDGRGRLVFLDVLFNLEILSADLKSRMAQAQQRR